jgi:zeaxanthin glucosyltransferase
MRIGFVSMPFMGHVNPMIALARKMQSSGHEITFIGVPDVGPSVRAAGLNFVSYCDEEFPIGSMAADQAPVSKIHGLEASLWFMRNLSGPYFKAASAHLPAALVESEIEALVLDMSHRFLELVPLSLGMPYVQVWNIQPIDGSGTTPPCLSSRPYEDNPEARAQNLEDVKLIGSYFQQLRVGAVDYAARCGLHIDWTDPAATASKLAIVAQVPKEFDFPGIPWPPQFHYAGPFFDDTARAPVPFPWEKLDSRPLVYASLGTLVNGIESIYKIILSALGKRPELQAVLSIGKNIQVAGLGPIPSNVIVVEKAPQIELLKRATLCITHAGLNTTLESLAHGVPMVAIPIGFDQPGVAARIAHHQVGEFIEVDDLTGDRLDGLIQKVLSTPTYHENAQRFKNIIAQRRGLDVAVEVIERALQAALGKSIKAPILSSLTVRETA